MSFLGKKLTGNFGGEIISDMKDAGPRTRIPGARIKHRVKENWLKMYDKAGSVLRVEREPIVNRPQQFLKFKQSHANLFSGSDPCIKAWCINIVKQRTRKNTGGHGQK